MINTLELPVEDLYIQVLLTGNTISYKDLEITDLTDYRNPDPRPRVQVYKRKNRIMKNKAFVTEEYNRVFYNYVDAIRDFLRMKAANFE